MRKNIVLGLALLLPALVFLFLKFFGKNEFEVAPLYQQATEAFPTDCQTSYKAPYHIADSIVTRLSNSSQASFYLLVFTDSTTDHAIQDKQVSRIKEVFANEPITLKRLDRKNTVDYATLKKCVFLLQEDQSVALVDLDGQICGQYDGNSLEEMDRLIVELKILLKQY